MISPIASGLELDDNGSSFKISRRWFSFIHIFTLFFSLIWNGFLVVWYKIAFGISAHSDSSIPDFAALLPLLFPIVHVAVGLGLLYFSLCGIFNKTIIEVNMGELSVRHTPLPWKGNVKVNVSDIEQLYCVDKVTYSRNGSSTSYGVNLVLKSNRTIRLINGIPDKEQVLSIENIIEKRLGITDVPVSGEMPKNRV
jgi:hypothetical protein